MKPYTYQIWDKLRKTWSQNSHFYLAPNGNLYRAGKNVTRLKIICFGSGVADSKGKEIIDGHIIEIGNESPPYFQVVRFREGQFQTRDDCEWISKIVCKDLGPGCVVVGHTLTHEIRLNKVVQKD